jgi:hypothetical protein
MSLSTVTRGPVAQPLRVVLYGTGGVGKSTFAAQAPAPIFLGPEDGSSLLDVARFPQPETWGDVLEAVRALTVEQHTYQTLAIDSLDWLEPLCWAHVCAAGRKSGIEEFGYGKGYVAALEEWRKLIAALEGLRRARRMHVVCIAHAVVAPYRNPEGDDYDRFQLKLHKSAAGLWSEWCDELLYAGWRTFASKVDQRAARGKGVGSERVCYSERRAAFDAKSRHGLPAEMDLDWSLFFASTQRGAAASASALRAEIDTALATLDSLAPDVAAKARGAVEGVSDPGRLAVLLNAVRARIAERSGTTTTEI